MYRQSDYRSHPPIAGFLPAIAGKRGVPTWAFYVNRGQGITSFGLGAKDQAILEYQPANKAYQEVERLGFRTFLDQGRGPEEAFLEDGEFSIAADRIGIVAGHSDFDLELRYGSLVEFPLGGLVRRLRIHRRASSGRLSLWDGLPRVLPFGANDQVAKNMSNTLMAWMFSPRVGQGVESFALRASFVDQALVEKVEGRHFMAACLRMPDGTVRIPETWVDPQAVFGLDAAFRKPRSLEQARLEGSQIREGRTPCAFVGFDLELAEGETLELYEVFGRSPEPGILESTLERIQDPDFLEENLERGRMLVQEVSEFASIQTASPLFDEYCRQTALDNVLRGGYPWKIDTAEGPVAYHLYSRKHGDLERDYNNFLIPDRYYSRGYGNFRDLCQNRRNDVWIDPGLEDAVLKEFLSLVQPDGYNPLEILGPGFILDGQEEDPGRKPGKTEEELLWRLRKSKVVYRHRFAEGYWIDHWTYILDLAQSYLDLYPDQAVSRFFEAAKVGYLSSGEGILPLGLRMSLVGGKLRQTRGPVPLNGSQDIFLPRTRLPKELEVIISSSESPVLGREALKYSGPSAAPPSWKSSYFEKLLLILGLKWASLDAQGIGTFMEAGRPGWYDALNGLPGLLGSSTSETFETMRLARMLTLLLEGAPEAEISLPLPALRLWRELISFHEEFSAGRMDRFSLWLCQERLKEEYRSTVYNGVPCPFLSLPRELVLEWISRAESDCARGLEAVGWPQDLPPCYYYASSFEWDQRLDHGHKVYQISSVSYEPLPAFLEASVKALKFAGDKEAALQIHEKTMRGVLHDSSLGMLKVNDDLGPAPMEIGRARSFTRGWLENESIWLHMQYKYLLEVLRTLGSREFWQLSKRMLVPFMDPQVYGRSTTENVSFIVSSAHPDRSIHGRGYVARLSGSTAEFLHILLLLLWGPEPFTWEGGNLCLRIRPALPGFLFPESGIICATMFGKVKVRIVNRARKDLFDGDPPCAYLVQTKDGDSHFIEAPVLGSPWAERIRAGKVLALDVFMDEPKNAEGGR